MYWWIIFVQRHVWDKWMGIPAIEFFLTLLTICPPLLQLLKRKTDHEHQCSHVKRSCETSYLDSLVQFPLVPYQCTAEAVECGRVQCEKCEVRRTWSVDWGAWRVECEVGIVECEV